MVAAGAVLTAGAVSAKTINMKIGMVTINDSNHFSAKWMKKEIEERQTVASKSVFFRLRSLVKFLVKLKQFN